jgi:hypothetical protein
VLLYPVRCLDKHYATRLSIEPGGQNPNQVSFHEFMHESGACHRDHFSLDQLDPLLSYVRQLQEFINRH